ncbi:DUF4136 domain-containing protein [Dyadobacter crusticola]|uniref:DUF4136 domain-containing protein n=1 Tax=Dyadobacter crusticola TaxID=292407 RepID=UPI0004E2106D|nr:DUF4136 domain-containing protein [Dyadobacter crusticola]
MKKIIFAVFGLSVLMLAGCSSSYKILNPEQEDNFRLSDYATFGFYEIEATGDTMPENFEKNVGIIKAAVARNLQGRGLDEARDASLKINIALNVKEKVQTRQTDFRTEGLPKYMGQRRYSWKSEEVVVGRYREGTLMVDLVDANNNRMVWQGGISGIIPSKSKNFEQEVNQAVTELIAKIPK